MRLLCIAVAIATITSLAFGQTEICDWEAPWQRLPPDADEFRYLTFSGSTAGVTSGNCATEETILRPGTAGTTSCRIDVVWAGASGGSGRWWCQDRPTWGDASVDHWLHQWIYAGANTNGLEFRWMPRDDGYERGDPITINWSGWRQLSIDLATATLTGWITGDGTLVLDAATNYDSHWIEQGSIGAVTSVLYFDDFYADAAVPVELSLFSTE